ncbi:unnamed protein product [Spirodela intermedia]|uniref:BTB domain-containing protein n=1 Tax=Spirodela intermedia TaxID=51605 RepID=A0A7I8L5D9_SPIIN|nr:unnamed protein product [Spirodela intermedia]
MDRSGFDVHGSPNGKLETISRLVQWTLDNLPRRNYYESPRYYSNVFKVDKWDWYLTLYKKAGDSYIKLCPPKHPPIARIELRVYNFERGRRPTGSPVHKKLLQTDDDFICPMDSTFNDTFRVVVEFLDFKISPCWAYEVSMQYLENKLSRPCLSHTLEEDIHSDVTMNTAGGTLRAHKAVLEANSLVFHSMLLYDHQEKSPIEIKYILLEDLTSGNMLQRLRDYWIYKLDRLKKLDHLKECCKVYDVGEGTHEFFCDVDGELMVEMFQAVQTI